MKKISTTKFLLMLAVLALWGTGCATRNVNPPQPRANTGYVDFRADPDDGLCWEVARFDDGKQDFQRVFSELKPPPGAVLRLAFAPGSQRLRVTFLNRVIVNPAEIVVEVQDGKITPIRVTMIAAGTAFVRTEETSRGGTANGRYGQRTKISNYESVRYSLSAVAEAPIPYQPKEKMSYAR